MKTNTALDTVVGTSHQALVRVDLYAADDTLIGELPLRGGTIRGSARFGERWTGSVQVTGEQWAPRTVTDPLAGFTGAYVRVYGGANVSTVDQWVEVCRLLVNGSTLSRAKGEWSVDVDLIDVTGYVGQGAYQVWHPGLDETAQSLIKRVYSAYWPPSWPGAPAWDDTTTPYVVPVGAYWEDVDVGQVVWDLCSMANIGHYADWDGTLVLRDPLPDTPSVVRTLDAAADVTRYDIEWGRERGFGNSAIARFDPVGASGRATYSGRWNYRAQTGAPASGELRATDNGDGSAILRIHYNDASGYRRHAGLDRAAQGDLVRLVDVNGDEWVGETTSALDEDPATYFTFQVRTISGSLSPANQDQVEFSSYSRAVDPVIGTAEQTTGPLAVATVGRVIVEETHVGNVSQAVADARAQSLLRTSLRAHAGHIVEAIPDYRLEPHDDITVVFANGDTLTSRITELELPLSVGEPMRVAVRPFAPTT